jgi:hypothetical protein
MPFVVYKYKIIVKQGDEVFYEYLFKKFRQVH